jgi:hypothetical protein
MHTMGNKCPVDTVSKSLQLLQIPLRTVASDRQVVSYFVNVQQKALSCYEI